MKVEKLVQIIGSEFYTGVPDSQLAELCNYLMKVYGIDPKHHIIGANEGNCTALAAGYYLSTGKIPVVYLQNSGEGNIINPVASLLNNKVYAIPVVFIIGWRGEPGVKDEPQHIFQGEITLKLLDIMDIQYRIIDESSTDQEMETTMEKFHKDLQSGKSVAFIIRKKALNFDEKVEYKNEYRILREEAIEHITVAAQDGIIVSTTGKASRELFEIREKNGQKHDRDFLTVGSMGHSSSIALGIAMNRNDKKVWCIDGDGALLMHMGAMAVIGSVNPINFVHIILNNEAHESVGGMPTASKKLNIIEMAKSCNYTNTFSVTTIEELKNALETSNKADDLSLIEVKCAIGARNDLGRPNTSALENKISFMTKLNEDNI